jgi:hypothetical protein
MNGNSTFCQLTLDRSRWTPTPAASQPFPTRQGSILYASRPKNFPFMFPQHALGDFITNFISFLTLVPITTTLPNNTPKLHSNFHMQDTSSFHIYTIQLQCWWYVSLNLFVDNFFPSHVSHTIAFLLICIPSNSNLELFLYNVYCVLLLLCSRVVVTVLSSTNGLIICY